MFLSDLTYSVQVSPERTSFFSLSVVETSFVVSLSLLKSSQISVRPIIRGQDMKIIERNYAISEQLDDKTEREICIICSYKNFKGRVCSEELCNRQ